MHLFIVVIWSRNPLILMAICVLTCTGQLTKRLTKQQTKLTK